MPDSGRSLSSERDEFDRCTGCRYSAGHALDCPLYPQAEGRVSSCFICDKQGPLRPGQGGLMVCVEPCQSGRTTSSDERCACGRPLTGAGTCSLCEYVPERCNCVQSGYVEPGRTPSCGDPDYERCPECQASRHERHLDPCSQRPVAGRSVSSHEVEDVEYLPCCATCGNGVYRDDDGRWQHYPPVSAPASTQPRETAP